MTRIRIEQAAPLSETLDLTNLDVLLARVLEDHGADGFITLILSDDEALCRLNGEFKGTFVPTDVLSFDLADPVHPESDDLGDIYVSVDRAGVQAREASRCVSDEIAWLAIHGTLHLLGYRHDSPMARDSMRCREREYMARFREGIDLKGA